MKSCHVLINRFEDHLHVEVFKYKKAALKTRKRLMQIYAKEHLAKLYKADKHTYYNIDLGIEVTLFKAKVFHKR